MKIRDYDFIYDIDVLFQKKIVIYGAGMYGTICARLLEDAGVGYDCFCDKNGGETERYRNHPVITPDRLQEKASREDCMIIVGSQDYCEEMIEELEARKIDAYVCTWCGLRIGIELHIEDERFPEKFRKDAVMVKKIIVKHCTCGTLSGNRSGSDQFSTTDLGLLSGEGGFHYYISDIDEREDQFSTFGSSYSHHRI